MVAAKEGFHSSGSGLYIGTVDKGGRLCEDDVCFQRRFSIECTQSILRLIDSKTNGPGLYLSSDQHLAGPTSNCTVRPADQQEHLKNQQSKLDG